MTTCKRSRSTGSQQMELELTAWPAVSHARIPATPANAPASTASDQDCGRNFSGSFANYDRASSSWKTSAHFVKEDSTGFSEIWPASGIMRNGTVYRLPPLELPT